ncbi:MAG: RIP metalloprotease RseP [bacterium]|nr:RIP metalloprotease RseP [bacterium]
MAILYFFAALAALILSHEFGHFIVAKKSGIRVDEFGFGFPPRLFSFKKGETVYSFNLFPIGGFVKIHGEEGTEGGDSRSFASKPTVVRAAVLTAGVVFNIIVAWFLISAGFMAGMPTSASSAPAGAKIENVGVMVVQVQKGTPAEKAGLRAGDRLIGFSSIEEVQKFIASNKGKRVEIRYKRGDKFFSAEAVPDIKPEDGNGSLGVAMDEIGEVKLPVHLALWEGAKMTYNLTIIIAVSLFNFVVNAFRGLASFDQVLGPVGIVGATGAAAKIGIGYLLSFVAMLSINLAIINILPFPALDGGRLLFLAIEKAKGSPVNPKLSGIIHAAGMIFLLLLMLAITYKDIMRLF